MNTKMIEEERNCNWVEQFVYGLFHQCCGHSMRIKHAVSVWDAHCGKHKIEFVHPCRFAVCETCGCQHEMNFSTGGG